MQAVQVLINARGAPDSSQTSPLSSERLPDPELAALIKEISGALPIRIHRSSALDENHELEIWFPNRQSANKCKMIWNSSSLNGIKVTVNVRPSSCSLNSLPDTQFVSIMGIDEEANMQDIWNHIQRVVTIKTPLEMTMNWNALNECIVKCVTVKDAQQCIKAVRMSQMYVPSTGKTTTLWAQKGISWDKNKLKKKLSKLKKEQREEINVTMEMLMKLTVKKKRRKKKKVKVIEKPKDKKPGKFKLKKKDKFKKFRLNYRAKVKKLKASRGKK